MRDKLFDPVRGGMIYYYVRPNDDFVLNTLEKLQAMEDPWVDKLLRCHIDLLIDGPYAEEQNDGKSLKGSANQRVLFLTERYLPHRGLYERSARNAEVYMENNALFFVGIPNKTAWEQWNSAVAAVDS